jgi:hypothetical protein
VARRAGTRFTCTARFDVGRYPVYVTETGDSGKVRFGNPAPLVILDIQRVERAITTSILAQRHLSARVSCPPEVLQQQGLAFTCTATVAGARRYPFLVTQIDSSGRVRYEGQPSVSGRT